MYSKFISGLRSKRNNLVCLKLCIYDSMEGHISVHYMLKTTGVH